MPVASDRGGCICRAEKLVKEYDGFRAVDGVSFCVHHGEIFGFLGPNGAGKTTTVRMLCGLTRITRGRAVIGGRDVSREPREVKKLIGVVPDISNLYAELTCRENLLFCGEMYGLSRRERERRADELLRFFGLERFRDTKFKNLSKGLKRRLTIAAALMHRPRLLFLDEPTLGLDVLSRRRIWMVIRELNRRGVTIFLTTHNIYEAFKLCSRIAIINRGRIVAIGTPDELRRMVAAQSVIEAVLSPMPPLHEIKGLPGVLDAREAGEAVRITVSDLLAALSGLIDYARRNGLSITALTVREADAEEIFLSLLGGRDA